MSQTKGNDGRAARSAFWKRATTVVLACACAVFGLVLLGVFQSEPPHGVRPLIKGAPPPPNVDRRQHRDKRTLLSMLGGSGNAGGMINVDLDDPTQLEPLLSSSVHLVDITSDFAMMADAPENTYAGISAEFCRLDFDLHKKDPTSFPMFRHLVAASDGCSRRGGQHYRVDLKNFANLARRHDSENSDVRALNISGVVFHESRCGSTLVANALAAYNPAESRVYSESAPPIAAMKSVCGDDYQFCSVQQAGQILKDTMYLMSRSADVKEKHVFFKIQSIGSRNIEVFQHAFPQTPWIFVYRDPVQVMMSHLKQGPHYAICVRMRVRPGSLLNKMVEGKGLTVKELTDEQYCAAHLATITEAAVDAMQRSPHLGTPVNYDQLPGILYTDILPNKFGVQLSPTEINNIKKISGLYSKGTNGREGEFKDDSEKKEAIATDEAREGARMFLDESYKILEQGGIRDKSDSR